MSEPKYHAREVAALLYDRDAEIAKLQAENDGLRKLLYIEGWADAGIDRAIKEMSDV